MFASLIIWFHCGLSFVCLFVWLFVHLFILFKFLCESCNSEFAFNPVWCKMYSVLQIVCKNFMLLTFSIGMERVICMCICLSVHIWVWLLCISMHKSLSVPCTWHEFCNLFMSLTVLCYYICKSIQMIWC